MAVVIDGNAAAEAITADLRADVAALPASSVNTAIKQQEELLKVKERTLWQQLLGLQKALDQLLMQQAAVESANASGVFV